MIRQRFGRVLLLAAFCVFVLASTECAWVLWANVYVTKEGRPVDQFHSPDEAFTSKAGLR